MGALAVREGHPRLVFRPAQGPGPGRTFDEVRQLYKTDAMFRSIFEQALKGCESANQPAMAAACWIVSGEDRFAGMAARMLDEAKITESGSGSYSNVWSYAMAWDWLYDHPALGGGLRERAAKRIEERLHTELAQLDDTGMALWHGRNQAANGAMIAALALVGLPGQDAELRRATGHYAGALRALDFSEGWPEGPSYWIYNRALPYAMAADCFLTATGEEKLAGIAVRDVMRKIGLWTVYSYTPNGVFEPHGDSVGSLRLGETGMWEASVDYFARLSRDAGVVAGADFIRLRSPAPYGKRPIHWYAALAYDPSVRPRKGYDAQRPGLWLRANMPQTMLFGRESLGVAFMREKWGDVDELYASFKAGDMLAHHDNYNAGHFSIQLADCCSIDGSLRGVSVCGRVQVRICNPDGGVEQPAHPCSGRDVARVAGTAEQAVDGDFGRAAGDQPDGFRLPERGRFQEAIELGTALGTGHDHGVREHRGSWRLCRRRHHGGLQLDALRRSGQRG